MDAKEEIGKRVPHRRGDEPQHPANVTTYIDVFPTGVGMNRFQIYRQMFLTGVPHRRGDEPM